MKNTYQFYRERRSAVLQSMRDHSGGGLALVPTAPEVARNRDSLFPFRHDSYFYYLSGFPEPEAVVALVAGPDGDRQRAVLPRKERGARDLGRLPLRSRRRARDLRLRRGASDRVAARDAARARVRPSGAVHAARPVRPMGPAGHATAERRAQPRAHRRVRARRSRRRARHARRDAAPEGRARAEPHAARRRDLERRAPARDGARRGPAGSSTRSRPSCCTSSCATARRRSRIRRSSRRAPTPACCTIATTTAKWPPAICC